MIHVAWAVVVACGKEEMFTGESCTPFINLGGKPILAHVLTTLEHCADISGVMVLADKTRLDSVRGMAQMFGFSKVQSVQSGFASRQPSMASALAHLDEDASIVVVVDGSRPFLKAEMVAETIKSAKRYGSGVAAIPLLDAVKETKKGLTISKSLNDGALWVSQTPQAFRRDLLQKGYAAASKKKMELQDDAAALELIGEEARIVESSPLNLRIRTPADFTLAMALLKG